MLKVGVVGLGMGRGHLSAYLKDPRVSVEAIADIDENKLSEVATKNNIPQTYTNAEEMFEKAGLDAVSIAVPNFLHKGLTLAALNAGLHVLCEKPMSVSLADAQEMKKKVEECGKKFMLNLSFRYNPMSQSLKKIVDSGEVGDIYSGRTIWHRRRGMPGFGGWFGKKEQAGGGPLIDLGVHRLDLALWLMGYPNPISVSGATYNHIASAEAAKQKKEFTVEDLAMGFVRFDNGASLIVETSWALNQKEKELMETKLYGTKAGIVQRNKNEGYEFEALVYSEKEGMHTTQTVDIPAAANSSTYKEFIDAITEDREPTATAEHGVKLQKILEGLYRSAEEGREIVF